MTIDKLLTEIIINIDALLDLSISYQLNINGYVVTIHRLSTDTLMDIDAFID